MRAGITRRALIPAMSLGVVGTGLFWRSALAAGNNIASRDIGERLTLFTGAGGNVVVHEGPDSVVLIDGGAPDRAGDLLETVAERFDGKPVAALVNTHWHPAQTGANDLLGSQDVPIIAHENTRRWMSTRIEQHWGGPVFEPRDRVARPTRTFYLSDELQHGAQHIPLHYTPRAHTDGDIHAVFTDADVIAAGGIAYAGRYPVLDTATNGWIGEMLDATRTLLGRSDDNTVIVPAEGQPLGRADLLAQEEMLATILSRFQEYSSQGMGAEDMLEAGIAEEYVAAWGDPTDFILNAWDGLWDHMRGLRAF